MITKEQAIVALHRLDGDDADFIICRQFIEQQPDRQSVQVPDGWQIVPITVTPEIEAVYANDSGAYQTAQELHYAMLQAAMLNQPAPAGNQPQEG